MDGQMITNKIISNTVLKILRDLINIIKAYNGQIEYERDRESEIMENFVKFKVNFQAV